MYKKIEVEDGVFYMIPCGRVALDGVSETESEAEEYSLPSTQQTSEYEEIVFSPGNSDVDNSSETDGESDAEIVEISAK